MGTAHILIHMKRCFNHLPVHHSDPLQAVLGFRMERSDACVAEQAKAHRLVGLCVVARRAHGAKRRRGPTFAHFFDRTAGRAARSPCGFGRALHHARVAVEVDGAVLGFRLAASCEHFRDVLRGVEEHKLVIRSPSSVAHNSQAAAWLKGTFQGANDGLAQAR